MTERDLINLTDFQFGKFMEKLDVIIDRIDGVIKILELQTIVLEQQPECSHEKAIDRGVMGDRPGTKMYCPDCKQMFARIVEEE
jgi:hypothetical protein